MLFRSVVIGRNGFRVAVDHDGLVPVFTHRQSSVDTAVVKLDALADTVGPAAKHHDFFLIRGLRFALVSIGGVHVSCVGSELGCASVHPFEDGTNIGGMPLGANSRFGCFE